MIPRTPHPLDALHRHTALALMVIAILSWGLAGCATPAAKRLPRQGTEIMVCGQLYDIGAPVVLWTDPGGYDAYRVERRFVPWDEAGWGSRHGQPTEPARFGLRHGKVAAEHYAPAELERVRGGGWDLESLRRRVDQFVLHYDAAGTSRTCFRVLHDLRGLSVHFMIDLDGTIYQTLDVKERAWHATISNDRSIGVEIAGIGAYPPGSESSPLKHWYAIDASGRARITIPARLGDGGIRTPGFVGYPATSVPVTGTINGSRVEMWDFTPEQYRSLVHLSAALCSIFPAINPDYPRGPDGRVLDSALTAEQWESFRGILGHWHVQKNKIDPGPAMRWEHLIREVRARMGWRER